MPCLRAGVPNRGSIHTISGFGESSAQLVRLQFTESATQGYKCGLLPTVVASRAWRRTVARQQRFNVVCDPLECDRLPVGTFHVLTRLPTALNAGAFIRTT